jgi:hypothetical protein
MFVGMLLCFWQILWDCKSSRRNRVNKCQAKLEEAGLRYAVEGQLLEATGMRSRDSADLLAEDEDALRQAAWRWRFNRRWAQEQARQMDPEYGRQVAHCRLFTALPLLPL